MYNLTPCNDLFLLLPERLRRDPRAHGPGHRRPRRQDRRATQHPRRAVAPTLLQGGGGPVARQRLLDIKVGSSCLAPVELSDISPQQPAELA